MNRILVHDWMGSGSPPANPTEDDMRYGIGCMNDLMIDLAGLMINLLHAENQYKCYGLDDILDGLNEKTFGSLIGLLRSHYDGPDVNYSDMENIREDRNYFVHGFTTSGFEKKDAARLSALINRIARVKNQFSNANARVSKLNRKNASAEAQTFKKLLMEAARSCNVDGDGDVRLTDVGNVIAQNPARYGRLRAFYDESGGLEAYIEELGWLLIPLREDNKVKFLRLSSMR